jgi:hypothetical protein
MASSRAILGTVTGADPSLVTDGVPAGARKVVLIGTLGRNKLIDGLVQSGKLNASITGKCETFVVQVVEQPIANVDQALVIAGTEAIAPRPRPCASSGGAVSAHGQP